MPNTLQEQGFTHLLPILGLAIISTLVVSSMIPITRHYADGKSNVAGVYLAKEGDSGGGGSSSGEDSGSHDSGGSSGGSSGSGSSGGSSSGSSGSSGSSSGRSGSTQTTTTTSESKSKSNEIKKEIGKKEVETKEVKDSQRVEVKTTPEKIKTEIRQGNLRIKFEIENGQVKIETKVKSANEVEIELENEAENEAVEEVDAELEKAEIKVATAPGQIALVNKKVGALSNFPLSVNPTTRELTVTTPAGSKVVTVLPQKAIDNMLASHVIDDVTSEKVSNSLASIPEMVKLEIKNGVLVYQVKGTKTHKLLGFIPLKSGVEAFVSAENGQVIETNQSLLGRILNRIAP